MSSHTDCYIYKCPHLQPNGKCKFGFKLMANHCPAPLAVELYKDKNTNLRKPKDHKQQLDKDGLFNPNVTNYSEDI